VKLNLAQSLAALAALMFGLMLAGCSSTPMVDWNTRVGTYTYDQTAQELGKPDKSTKQDDGSVVAEWFLRHEVEPGAGPATAPGLYSPANGAGGNQIYNPAVQNDYLQLTFGPDGKLKKSATITR
jgi:hypothetical protein